MTATIDINSIRVSEAMTPVQLCVRQTDKLNDVAKLFLEKGLNSAPVIDDKDRCVGIITSSDLVRYQSLLPEVNSKIDHGMSFEVTTRAEDGSLVLAERPFDEVMRHMTTCLQTIDPDQTLGVASQIMCEQHIHHLIVLDKSGHPAGILSALDILTKLSG